MRLGQAIRDFLFGAFLLDLYRETAKAHRQLLTVTEFLVFGEFVGVPLLSTYYALRLLPYFVGDLYDFKREIMKDRDVMEEISEVDVH
ncbi:hypothetical protein TUZN_1274 [Thermoproteus uzoniensis 768-20]|uniref:Uncharacterized protein n=1 Tax=Thermoproteus uzoniensis (strain 768-20) TaxID=999630 RepID=F2L0T5_THEU7|nr:hypothetical protein [Thermoproteus uzoniensis]AEA12750.1 hypothetical protein TUZN_1274 [Thermoproteus uzoniensis 768-20]